MLQRSPVQGPDGPIAFGPIASDEIQALRRHPRFPEASAAWARGVVDLYHGNRVLNLLANDRGRVFLALLALALHGEGEDARSPGLAAASLRAAAVRTGLSSPGRVRAMIALMQWAALLATGEGGRLLPTDRLIGMHQERFRRQLTAGAMILPDLARGVARCDDRTFVLALARMQADQFLSGFRFTAIAPELDVFIEQNAGLLVLFALCLGAAPGTPFPPRGPVPLSISALARTFKVSRPHVARLLQGAERMQLIARAGDGVTLSAHLVEAMELFFASVFLLNAWCVRGALQACR